MKSLKHHFPTSPSLYALGAVVVLAFGVAYMGYTKNKLSNTLAITELRFSNLQTEYASTTKALDGARVALDTLQGMVTSTQEERNTLAQRLAVEIAKTGSFEQQIEQINNTVGTLRKLSETDSELLQKYSKVYFLNEHYVPKELVVIDADAVFQSDKEIKMHGAVWPFLKGMLVAAKNEGIEIKVVSGYRSFAEQTGLKAAYKSTFGSGANQFSAEQGYSEHQLGTTVDLTTKEVGGTYVTFEKTTAFKWLTENAHKFGFTLSYPKNNAYYEYEPWHWRFVGRALAEKLYTNKAYFYDVDQRDINSYLISIFN